MSCDDSEDDTNTAVTKPKPISPTTTPSPTDNQPIVIQPRLPKGVVFFDAEGFDSGKSTLEGGVTKWEIKDELNALGGKCAVPTGADRKKETELIYQVPEITGGGKSWKLWMRVTMPEIGDKAADSFPWDLSCDGKT